MTEMLEEEMDKFDRVLHHVIKSDTGRLQHGRGRMLLREVLLGAVPPGSSFTVQKVVGHILQKTINGVSSHGNVGAIEIWHPVRLKQFMLAMSFANTSQVRKAIRTAVSERWLRKRKAGSGTEFEYSIGERIIEEIVKKVEDEI